MPPPEPGAAGLAYLPLFLEVRGRRCLLLGGGGAAAAKARLLLRAGAEVRLVAPGVEAEMRELLGATGLHWRRGAFRDEDLEGCLLAIDAAGEPAETARLRAAAAARNILVNVVDRPASCDFVVPAIVDRSPIVIAIGSGGAAPVLARKLRQRLERLLPESYARVARVLAAQRPRINASLPAGPVRRHFWDELLSDAGLEALAGLDEKSAVRRIGERLAGTLASLASGRAGGGSAPVTLLAARDDDIERLPTRAAEAIETADVILHDAAAPPRVASLARREARLVGLARGRAGGCAKPGDPSRLMVRWSRRGLRVVRLLGDDPQSRTRLDAELTYLDRHRIPVAHFVS